MLHSLQMTGFSGKHVSPFICPSIPFIGHKSPVIVPFICQRQPLVGNSGFTLIELVITLTIIGILAAFVIPGMRTFVQSNRLVAQTNDLIADLSYARSEAIKRSKTVVVCKSSNPGATPPACDTAVATAWGQGRLVFADGNGDNSYSANTADILLRTRESVDGVTLSSFTATVAPNLANFLAYTSTGLTNLAATTTVDGPHRFKLCSPSGTVRGLIIEPNGKTQLVQASTFTWSATNYTLTCP